ncbi:MAG: branched-chain amino acid transport system substrate-binding protein [Thermoleophilaceae bacterium]|nr:branched-chain amino acid transport system substrate-binding protein [Thermoleophilaceae bacterium]
MSRVRWLALLSCLLGLFGLTVAACGSNDNESSSGSGGSGISGDTLTIYSSLPLQGTSKGQSEAVISGEKLALKQAGNKVGKFTIKYSSLDDSTAQNPGTADEAQTASNARKAVQDKTTIFYLGEFNSGGTKVSLPILNKANIPQISPSNTYVGLTTDKPGSEPGEPDKYYPAQKRTYARVVPADDIQGAALVTTMKEDGCKSVHIFNDKTTYGAGLARNIELAAEAQSLQVEGNDGTDRNAPNYRSLAAKVKADCFVGSGVTGENYVQVFKDVAAANPTAKLYGPDGVAEEAFTNPAKGGIPADVGARTKITVATLGLEEFKKRNNAEAEKFFTDYEKEYGDPTPDPYAIYGYETMSLALASLKAVGDKANDREAVRAQLLGNTKDRESALGVYSIDENGDTTLTDYGLYLIKGGEPTFEKVIKAQAAG